MKPTVKGINLLPKEYIQAQRIKLYLLIAAAALALECVVFVITVVLPPIAKINEQEVQITQLQQELASSKFAEVNKTIDELNAAKEAVQKWVDKCQGIKKPGFISGQLFDELITRLPQGITIDKMDISTASEGSETNYIIKLDGKMQSEKSFFQYVSLIESTYKDAVVTFKVKNDNKAFYQGYTMMVKIPMLQASTSSQTKQSDEGKTADQTTSAATTTSSNDTTAEGEAQ